MAGTARALRPAEQLQFAIRGRRLIQLRYKNGVRVVEPHDFGVQAGVSRLLAYQRRGPARPGRSPVGWRLFDVDEIQALAVLEETFPGSRGDAHPTHMTWDVLHARVDKAAG
jgi:predicted DNA-binding transcriptional regulator YafY